MIIRCVRVSDCCLRDTFDASRYFDLVHPENFLLFLQNLKCKLLLWKFNFLILYFPDFCLIHN